MEDRKKCSIIIFWSLLWEKTGSIIAVYGDGDIPVPAGAKISRTGQLIGSIRKKTEKNQLGWEYGKSPLLENTQELPGHSPVQCLVGWPCLSRVCGSSDPLLSLPTRPTLWFPVSLSTLRKFLNLESTVVSCQCFKKSECGRIGGCKPISLNHLFWK